MQNILTGPRLGTGFFELTTEEVKVVPELKLPAVEEKLEKPTRAFPFGNDVGTLLANAEILLKNDEKLLAQHLIRKSLYLNSHHPEALRKLSRTFNSVRNIDLKTKTLEALVKADYSFETVAELADCYYQQNKDLEASQKYHEALGLLTEETPALFEVYKNLGNIAIREGDYDGAEEYYNKAQTQKPRSDVLSVNKGTLALQRSETAEALVQFRTALEINYKNDKAWVGLAMVHNIMGDFVLARANVFNACDVNPKNRTAVQLSASWAIRDQDYGMAIEVLQNYLCEVETDEEMSLLLVHVFCLRNQFSEALLEVERLLLWEPGNQKVQAVENEIKAMKNA